MSRVASRWINSFRPILLDMAKGLLQFLENIGRHVLLPSLGVQRQHPEFIGPVSDEVNHSQAAPLAGGLTPPGQRPFPARAAHDVPPLLVCPPEPLQNGLFLLV